jgi:hypothetical protein
MVEKSTSVDQPVKGGQIQAPTPFSRFIRQLSLEAEIDSADNRGNTATLATVERILTAETEDIWNAGDLANIGGRNLVDVEMTVTDFTVKYGTRDDVESVFVDNNGRKFFLLIQSTIIGIPTTDAQEFGRPPLEIGQEIVWNTSAPDIVPKLVAFRDRELFPLDCVIRALDLGSGKHYLRLKPVPKRAVR